MGQQSSQLAAMPACCGADLPPLPSKLFRIDLTSMYKHRRDIPAAVRLSIQIVAEKHNMLHVLKALSTENTQRIRFETHRLVEYLEAADEDVDEKILRTFHPYALFLFLREFCDQLPDSLLTFHRYYQFIGAMDKLEHVSGMCSRGIDFFDRMFFIQSLCATLPLAHLRLLQLLIGLFRRLCDFEASLPSNRFEYHSTAPPPPPMRNSHNNVDGMRDDDTILETTLASDYTLDTTVGDDIDNQFPVEVITPEIANEEKHKDNNNGSKNNNTAESKDKAIHTSHTHTIPPAHNSPQKRQFPATTITTTAHQAKHNLSSPAGTSAFHSDAVLPQSSKGEDVDADGHTKLAGPYVSQLAEKTITIDNIQRKLSVFFGASLLRIKKHRALYSMGTVQPVGDSGGCCASVVDDDNEYTDDRAKTVLHLEQVAKETLVCYLINHYGAIFRANPPRLLSSECLLSATLQEENEIKAGVLSRLQRSHQRICMKTSTSHYRRKALLRHFQAWKGTRRNASLPYAAAITSPVYHSPLQKSAMVDASQSYNPFNRRSSPQKTKKTTAMPSSPELPILSVPLRSPQILASHIHASSSSSSPLPPSTLKSSADTSPLQYRYKGNSDRSLPIQHLGAEDLDKVYELQRRDAMLASKTAMKYYSSLMQKRVPNDVCSLPSSASVYSPSQKLFHAL